MATYHYSYLDVINKYKRYFFDKDDAPGSTIRRRQGNIDSRVKWMGASKEDMLDRIESGYTFEEMPSTQLPDASEGEGSRWYFTDDPDGAEYQYDLDEGGEMEYYLKRKPVIGHPGIKIRIDMCFSASQDAKVIEQYGLWVGSLIQTLENNDYDLELDFYSHTRNYVDSETDTMIEVEVSKFGEVIFFDDFSCFFSPGGYRHLFHFAMMLPEEDGHTVGSSLGTPTNHAYGLDWDEENRVLHVQAKAHAHEFPVELMNNALADVIETID